MAYPQSISRAQSPALPVEKPCTYCGVTKPLRDFVPRPGARDGTRTKCKECYNQGRARWRDENRASVTAYQHTYKAQRREDLAAHQRAYYRESNRTGGVWSGSCSEAGA